MEVDALSKGGKSKSGNVKSATVKRWQGGVLQL